MTPDLKCQTKLAEKVQSELSSLERDSDKFKKDLQEKLLHTLIWNVEQIMRVEILTGFFLHIEQAFIAMQTKETEEPYCIRISKCINSFRERYLEHLLIAEFASTSSSVGHNMEKVQKAKALTYLVNWLDRCSEVVHTIYD